MSIPRSLLYALGNLLHPRMLWLISGRCLWLLLWSTAAFFLLAGSSPPRRRIDQFLHDNLTFLALDSTTGPDRRQR